MRAVSLLGLAVFIQQANGRTTQKGFSLLRLGTKNRRSQTSPLSPTKDAVSSGENGSSSKSPVKGKRRFRLPITNPVKNLFKKGRRVLKKGLGIMQKKTIAGKRIQRKDDVGSGGDDGPPSTRAGGDAQGPPLMKNTAENQAQDRLSLSSQDKIKDTPFSTEARQTARAIIQCRRDRGLC